jgi:hypothetical protein
MIQGDYKSISQNEHRYSTLGDYWDDGDGIIHYRISELGNSYYERLILIHEMVEWMLCEKKGIKEPDIKKWDEDHPDSDDPGSEPGCIYGDEHKFAELIENMICYKLGISWDDYNKALDSYIQKEWPDDPMFKTGNLA